MISPVKEVHLTLYLTSTDKSIGALLAQEVKGAEHPVYYLSRSLRGTETNYSMIQHHCLALVFCYTEAPSPVSRTSSQPSYTVKPTEIPPVKTSNVRENGSMDPPTK